MSALARKIRAASGTPAWHLALDKFPYRLDDGIPSLSTPPDSRGNTKGVKGDRLREIRDTFNGSSVPHLEIALAARRAFLDELETQHGSCFRRVPLVNASRLLLHLGRASVLENVGLYCDRTTGLPLIPGSAVKGVVSAWACWESNEAVLFPDTLQTALTLNENRQQFSASLAREVLGDNSPGGSDQSGRVTFLGAFPEAVPKMGLDIVTPHTDAVGEDRSPVPNPFLCIEPGTTWTFALLVNSEHAPDLATKLLDATSEWLTDCLGQSGLGAKTAAGYGRFVTLEDWNKAARSQSVSASVSAGAGTAPARVGDYENEKVFANRVLTNLNPGKLANLQSEIGLLVKPENEDWKAKLVEALRGNDMKKLRKTLKEKTWFPDDWFPQ